MKAKAERNGSPETLFQDQRERTYCIRTSGSQQPFGHSVPARTWQAVAKRDVGGVWIFLCQVITRSQTYSVRSISQTSSSTPHISMFLAGDLWAVQLKGESPGAEGLGTCWDHVQKPYVR